MPKICNFKNSITFEFGTFQKFPKFSNFENHQISEIVQFRKIANFQNFPIWKTQNSINFQFYKLSYILSVRIILKNMKI